jgi:hypothetical protein
MMTTSNNNSPDDIKSKLDSLHDMRSHINNLKLSRQSELDDAISDEIQERIDEIKTRCDTRITELLNETNQLSDSIKALALESGHTKVKATHLQIFPVQYAPKWNSKRLCDFAVGRPEINEFIVAPGHTKITIKNV